MITRLSFACCLLVTLALNCDGRSLTVTHQPQTNPHYVKVIWMTDASGATEYATPTDGFPQDYAARLRTAAQLMQTFTAEKMHDQGRPRKTFRLERDDRGQIIVHTLRGPKLSEYYYGISDNPWWSETRRWLNANHPDPYAKNIVLAAYTRKDPKSGAMKAHTAIGGANLGLFGSASVFSWPTSLGNAFETFSDDSHFDETRVHNDSVGRNTIWGLASTTIGATLHEMGHTLGLPHCNDSLGIMRRGFDHFNRVFSFQDPPSDRSRKAFDFPKQQEACFAPISASFLQHSPWFQADEVQLEEQDDKDTSPPVISVDSDSGSVTVECESGIAWVGFWVDSNVYAFKEFDSKSRESIQKFSKEEIEKLIDGKQLSTVTTISLGGQTARRAIR